MARYLFSRVDNHKITRGDLTGRAAANVKRALDPTSVVADGIIHGNMIEDTQFNFDARWGAEIGTTANNRREWRHPTTGLVMSVNPNFYIIEVPTVDHAGPVSEAILEDGPDDASGESLQRRARRLNPTGLPAANLAELEATHRLRLTLAEMSVAMTIRLTVL